MKTCNAKIISAGGVLDMLDLFELKNIGVYGAIVGRAFLENRLNLRDSFRMTELGGTTVNEAK
jgi:phosphoribosylformimino-5-aminoimidazole carboxamide ribonucleotide (ProFAR) isomerase